MACAANMAYNKSVNIYNLFDELWIAEDYHEHSWYSRGLTVLWAVLCCLWIYFIPRSRVILVEEVYKFSDYDFGRGKNWIWRDGIGFMIQFVQDLVINIVICLLNSVYLLKMTDDEHDWFGDVSKFFCSIPEEIDHQIDFGWCLLVIMSRYSSHLIIILTNNYHLY